MALKLRDARARGRERDQRRTTWRQRRRDSHIFAVAALGRERGCDRHHVLDRERYRLAVQAAPRHSDLHVADRAGADDDGEVQAAQRLRRGPVASVRRARQHRTEAHPRPGSRHPRASATNSPFPRAGTPDGGGAGAGAGDAGRRSCPGPRAQRGRRAPQPRTPSLRARLCRSILPFQTATCRFSESNPSTNWPRYVDKTRMRMRFGTSMAARPRGPGAGGLRGWSARAVRLPPRAGAGMAGK